MKGLGVWKQALGQKSEQKETREPKNTSHTAGPSGIAGMHFLLLDSLVWTLAMLDTFSMGC